MTNRIPFSPFSPYRTKRPSTDKLIFIVCEGEVTEYDYFSKVVPQVYDDIKTRIQIINVFEEILRKREKYRSEEEKRKLSSSKPHNLLEKMDDFINEKETEYDFSKHKEDEFWLIMDIDDHTDEYYINEWKRVINKCHEKGYKCAISNPFFEFWLMLHFDEITIEDKKYAVTSEHKYEKTNHFKNRLSNLGVALKQGKHISNKHAYTKENIQLAIERACKLDNAEDLWPKDLGSTVYKLMNIIDKYE